MKKGKIAFLAIIGLLLVITGAVLYENSISGQVEPCLDEEGNILENSIARREYVEVNGRKIGMFIRGENKDNPVLLFLHGGPGMPQYLLKEKYSIELEKDFTVVWLEQRGAGISYSKEIDPSEITLEQFISDDVEITKYLCKEFNQNKIYLLAHSWGTTVGIRLAKQYPELYHAYIAMAQVTNQELSEEMAYEYMTDYFEKSGEKKELQKIKKGDVNSSVYKKNRDHFMHKAGVGTCRNMDSILTGVIIPGMKCKAYRIPERFRLWEALFFSQKAWKKNDQKIYENNVISEINSLEIPIYFFSGAYDYTVNYKLVEQFYEKLDAPKKEFYLFENSAHSPIFEEPQKAEKILQEIKIIGKKNEPVHFDIEKRSFL